jgi:sugar phosphate permease
VASSFDVTASPILFSLTKFSVKTPNRYKWELLLLMFFALFLNQGDRQIYNAVLPLIKADLGLSDVQLGSVVTIFTLLFAACVPFAGFLGDFVSKKWIVCLSLIVFSGGTLLTGFSNGLILLILFRSVATGMGEAFYFPAANSLLGQYHTKTRSMAMAVHQAALYFGVIVSSWGAGWIGEHYGWRATFYVFGGLGLVLAAFVALRVRNERKDPEIVGAAASAKAKPEGDGVGVKEALRNISKVPTIYYMSLAYGGMVFVFIGYMTWMPTFLHEKFSLSVKDAALNAVLAHFLSAFVGVMIGGRIADKFAARRPAARIEIPALGLLLGAPFIAAIGFMDTMTGVTIAMAGFGFFRGFFDSNLFAVPFEVIRTRYISSATGLMVCCAFFIGSTSPVILGYYKEKIDLGLGISGLGAMYFIGACLLFYARWRHFQRDRDAIADDVRTDVQLNVH